MSKLLGNLVAAPQEARYRQVRLDNPRVHAAVVTVPGALSLLAAAGFTVHEAAAAQDEGFAAFLDDSALPAAHEALRLLRAVQPSLTAVLQQEAASSCQAGASTLQAAPTSSKTPPHATQPLAARATSSQGQQLQQPPLLQPPPPPRVSRDTCVVLPAEPNVQLPDDFFERTGAELKAEYLSLLRRRQQGQQVVSRRPQAPAPVKSEAAVRVRFPEGLCLQGHFHASEPLADVFSWVTSALADPGTTYELVAPNRRPLIASGSVGDAQLVPAVVLNFRPLSSSSTNRGSYLSDELIKCARAE